MPHRENSIYTGVTIPRTSLWTTPPAPIRAKSHPKYVHGKVGMAMLLHKIDHVNLRWWDYGFHEFLRLKHPIIMARTVCGASWRLEAGKAGTCQLPSPDAILCGMCHGTGRIWKRGDKNPPITKRQAKDRLGCIAEGTQI